MAEFRHLGKNQPRLGARDIVTGRAKYAADLRIPRMLYAKVLRSPHAYAKIVRIDTARAEALKGVKAVVTYKNAPPWKSGMIIPHKKLLDDTVYFVGDAVALIAAESEEIADEARDLIEVEYEVMKPVLSIADMSLLENMYLSEHTLSATRFHINKRAEREKFENYRRLLNIKAQDADDSILSLSGGNQQKVFIARWLNTNADILLLDNPTQGIDVGAKAEIYKLILELAKQGKTILINTLEIPEIQRIADLCMIFYEGRIIKVLPHEEIDEQTVMLYSTNAANV